MPFTVSRITLIAIATFITCTTRAQSPESLLAIPDQIVLQADFSKAVTLPKNVWLPRQGTRWNVEDGVLRGRQSSTKYQAARQDHFGYEPRISVPATPRDFIASFRIRFIGGSETKIAPFIEFDHHVCRVRFSQDGTALLADHESWKVAEAKNFVWNPGQWYYITAERRSSEFVMQIENGPTLYANHPTFAKAASSGGNGLGVAGSKKGVVEIDDLTIWSIKAETRADWPRLRAKLPKLTPVQLKKPKTKSKKRSKQTLPATEGPKTNAGKIKK